MCAHDLPGEGVLFTYRTSQGVVNIPYAEHIPYELVRRLPRTNDMMFDLIEQLVSPEHMDVIDRIPQGEFGRMLEAWQEASTVTVGDCFGLYELCREHGQALEADLIKSGLRMRYAGETWFTWADFISFVRWLPRDSALIRSKNPDYDGWGIAEYQLADMVDSLSWLVWAKTKDGEKGRNKPEPYPRPGAKDVGKKRTRGKAVPMDKVKERLQAIGVQQ